MLEIDELSNLKIKTKLYREVRNQDTVYHI